MNCKAIALGWMMLEWSKGLRFIKMAHLRRQPIIIIMKYITHTNTDDLGPELLKAHNNPKTVQSRLLLTLSVQWGPPQHESGNLDLNSNSAPQQPPLVNDTLWFIRWVNKLEPLKHSERNEMSTLKSAGCFGHATLVLKNTKPTLKLAGPTIVSHQMSC